jgi:tetratricopeptide (TPR) repeat protein
MGKKRTKTAKRKQPVKETPSSLKSPVPADSPNVPTRQRKPIRPVVWIAAFVVIAGIGFAAFKLYPKKESSSSEKDVSQPVDSEKFLRSLATDPFPRTEKQVVEKIHRLVKEVEANTGSAFAWGKLGMNLQIHDFQSKAIPCYIKASELNPDDFRWHYYKAMILHEMGDEEALKSYERAITIKPTSAPAHYRYGKALFEKKQTESAKTELQKALEADPQMIAAYVELARIAMAEDQLEESYRLITQSIKLNPSYGEAHALLSQILRRSGRHDEAAKQTRLAQQLNNKKIAVPDEAMQDLAMEGVSSYWYELRARSYIEKGRYRDAVQELKLAIEAAKEPRFFDTLGIAYQLQGQYKEAVEQHQQAVQLSPGSATLLSNLASAQLGLGNVEEAIKAAMAALQADPNSPAPYLQLARIHVSNGRTAAAVEILERGHKSIPENRTIGLQLAWLRATALQNSLRDGKEAARLTQNYCRSETSDLECLVVSAATHAEMQNFEKAIDLAERAKKIAENGAPEETLARIHQQLSRYRSQQPLRE